MVDFDTREGIMKEWDKWVRHYSTGIASSWPRDAFESLLDHFDDEKKELIQQYRAESERRWIPDKGYQNRFVHGESLVYQRCADDLEKLLREKMVVLGKAPHNKLINPTRERRNNYGNRILL